jgi:hypothetical protein
MIGNSGVKKGLVVAAVEGRASLQLHTSSKQYLQALEADRSDFQPL